MSTNAKFWNSIDTYPEPIAHRSDVRYLDHEFTIKGEDSGFSSGAGLVVCHVEERFPGGMWIYKRDRSSYWMVPTYPCAE